MKKLEKIQLQAIISVMPRGNKFLKSENSYSMKGLFEQKLRFHISHNDFQKLMRERFTHKQLDVGYTFSVDIYDIDKSFWRLLK